MTRPTPLLDKLAAGEGLAASEIHGALRELEALDAGENCATLRAFSHPQSGKERCQIVLPSNRFVISDTIEDALLTACKLATDPGAAEAAA